MAVYSNTMIITNESLIRVSKELMDKRVFDPTKITKVGLPIVKNGIASNFSSSNYFEKKGMSLLETYEYAKITISGRHLVSEEPQVLFYLSNTPETSRREVVFENGSIGYKNNGVLKETVKVDLLKGETEFSLNFYIYVSDTTSSQVKIQLSTDEGMFEKSFWVDWKERLVGMNSIHIGKGYQGADVWKGSVDLSSVSVTKNMLVDEKEVLVEAYTPTKENVFNFTKMMVSDGLYPLTDDSKNIYDHVYTYPITEIRRTHNNILLVAEIPEDSFININQIGLYGSDSEGSFLFSLMDNIKIKKGKDLKYNLVLTVRMDLNVVNTIMMPEIIVKDLPVINLSEFETVQRVFLYLLTCLERMIKINALGTGTYKKGEMNPLMMTGIGLNKAQQLYRMIDIIDLWKQNFESTSAFAKIRARFLSVFVYVFDRESLNINGELYVTDDGEASGFNGFNYASLHEPSFDKDFWNIEGSFMISNTVNNQTILCLTNSGTVQPLSLTVEKGICKLRTGIQEELLGTYKGGTVGFSRGRRPLYIDDVPYYPWLISSETLIYTDRVVSNGTATMSEDRICENFENGYMSSKKIVEFGEDWDIGITFSRTNFDLLGNQCLLWGGPIVISINNNTPTAYVINDDGAVVTKIESSKEALGTDKFNVSVNKSEDKITLYLNEEEVGTATLEDSPSLPTTGTIILGGPGGCEEVSDHFSGSIYALETTLSGKNYWEASQEVATVFTAEENPQPGCVLYDDIAYRIEGVEIKNIVTGYLFEENLFAVFPMAKYNFKISYDGEEYRAYYSLRNKDLTNCFQYNSPYRINAVNELLIGVNNDKEEPFSGTIYLNDFYAYERGGKPEKGLFQSELAKGPKVINFFEIPDTYLSTFEVTDLCNDNSNSLTVCENGITGNFDDIDFKKEGISLCIKTHLKDDTEKVIIAKKNSTRTYFDLCQGSYSLRFSIYGSSEVYTLEYVYTDEEAQLFVANPINVSFTLETNDSVSTARLYRNNKLLAEEEFIDMKLVEDLRGYRLTNMPYGEEPDDRYVQGIYVFEGALTPDDVYYINNAIDTNRH